MTGEITVTLLLVTTQVLALRLSQYAFPSLYFTTRSLFERRSEVTAGAILFRLSIPFAAGAIVPLLVDEHEFAIAAASGALAWFLILWPILWAPSLMLPDAEKWPIIALLLAFWAAFASLPIAGALLTEAILDLTSDNDIDWVADVVVSAVLLIPTAVVTWFLAKVVRAKVSFADDAPDTEEFDEDIDDYQPSFGERVQEISYGIPSSVIALVALVTLLAFLVRRRGSH